MNFGVLPRKFGRNIRSTSLPLHAAYQLESKCNQKPYVEDAKSKLEVVLSTLLFRLFLLEYLSRFACDLLASSFHRVLILTSKPE